MEEIIKRIKEDCMHQKEKNPIIIFNTLANKKYIRIHGPEHHILDGACLLTAYYNAGGSIDLNNALDEIMSRGKKMPGAMCGMWGVCGAVSSLGAALSIIDNTTPLSSDSSWGKHMEYTSHTLNKLSKIGGPRCCKRDAFVSLQTAIDFINIHYPIQLETSSIICHFHDKNQQCIKTRCPFYK